MMSNMLYDNFRQPELALENSEDKRKLEELTRQILEARHIQANKRQRDSANIAMEEKRNTSQKGDVTSSKVAG